MVTYYTVFVINLASRRVQIPGSTPHSEALFMQQAAWTLMMAEDGPMHAPHILICDRDRKWSGHVRRQRQSDAWHALVKDKLEFWLKQELAR